MPLIDIKPAHGLRPLVNHTFPIRQMLAPAANRDNTCDHVDVLPTLCATGLFRRAGAGLFLRAAACVFSPVPYNAPGFYYSGY